MVCAGGELFQLRHFFDVNRAVDHELACEFWPSSREHQLFAGGGRLLNREDKESAVLGHDEHSGPGEGDLADFHASWEGGDLSEGLSNAIRDLSYFDRAHLCFGTNIELALFVDVRFVIPAERHVDDVRRVWPHERPDLLWSEVRILLTRVDLEALAPHVDIRVELLDPVPGLLACLSLAEEGWSE